MSPIGQLICTAAVIDDVLSLLLLAEVQALGQDDPEVQIATTLLRVVLCVALRGARFCCSGRLNCVQYTGLSDMSRRHTFSALRLAETTSSLDAGLDYFEQESACGSALPFCHHRVLSFHMDRHVTFCLLSCCISDDNTIVPFPCDFPPHQIIRQQTVVCVRVARGGLGWLGPRRESRHNIHQFTNKTAQRVARVPQSLTSNSNNSDRRSTSSSKRE